MQIITRQNRSGQDFHSPGVRARVFKGILRAIERSFVEYPMRGKTTRAEVSRRQTICYEAYKVFRNEYGYGTVRAIDHLYAILESSLSGKVYQFATARSSWFGSSST